MVNLHKSITELLKIMYPTSKGFVDHEEVLQSLYFFHQRDRRPQINKDRACHRHSPLIASRGVAPLAARMVEAFSPGIVRLANPPRGWR